VDLAKAQMTREEFFAEAGLEPAVATVALLPGSREKEVALNLPPMLGAGARLAASRKVQFVLPLAPTLDADWMDSLIRKHGSGRAEIRVVTHATHDALEHTDIAVVASGTATLEAALHARPMVVVYRVSALTWWVGKLLVGVPYYSMVNLLAGRPLVTELMQSNFTGLKVAAQVQFLLDHPEARGNMADALRALRSRLGPGGAIGRAAEVVANAYNSREATIQRR
jgi:lipid-A-disaccharide synthase